MLRLACARRAADSVLTPGTSQFARARFRHRGQSSFESWTDSLETISVFEAATVDGGAYVRLERRIKGLDPRTGNLIMCIAEGTPNRYPRHLVFKMSWLNVFNLTWHFSKRNIKIVYCGAISLLLVVHWLILPRELLCHYICHYFLYVSQVLIYWHMSYLH